MFFVFDEIRVCITLIKILYELITTRNICINCRVRVINC